MRQTDRETDATASPPHTPPPPEHAHLHTLRVTYGDQLVLVTFPDSYYGEHKSALPVVFSNAVI